MDTINTTTPPFITNTISGTSLLNISGDLRNIRLEPTTSGVFKFDDDIIFFLKSK